MRKILVSLVLIVHAAIAVGCGKPPSEESAGTGAGYSGRAQPRECVTDAQCAPDEECSARLCGQPAPSSTDYRACTLDADCPRGDHCILGACSHECLSDRDCADSTVCTNRGRCVVPESAAKPPPVEPPLPSSLEVSAETLQFDRTTHELEVTLRNTGGTPLRFRALSDRPWLSADPFEGEVSGQPVTLRVKVDRNAAGPDVRATLAINSTGGRKAVGAFLARDLKGVYAGEVVFTAPFPNGASTLRLKLAQAEGTTQIRGVVDAEGSLLFPAKAAVSGTITEGDVNLSFDLAGAQGSLVNPVFRRAIRRTVTLSGNASGVGRIEGTITDSIEGPFEGDPLRLSGTFRLERVGDYDGNDLPESTPQVSLPPVANPFANGYFANCEANCPSGGCNGSSFLRAAAPFYQWFATEAWGDDSPFADLSATGFSCSGTTCVDHGKLRCAQYHFEKSLRASPEDAAASRGFLDALEVMADYSLLFGNQRLVDATNAWKTPGSIGSEVQVVESANRVFRLGNHVDEDGQPYAMFDPGVLAVIVKSVAPSALSDDSSEISALLGDFGQRASFEHLRRQALSLGGLVRGHLELASRLQRTGRVEEAKAVATQGSMIGFLDLAILGRLVGKSGQSATLDEVRPVLSDLEQLAAVHQDLNTGRNPAGYLESYIPFLLDVSQLPKNSFEQILAFAKSFSSGRAKSDLENARATAREFEQSAQALQTELNNQAEENERLLEAACGENLQEPCGQPGSELAVAGHEAVAAALRVKQAAARIENLSAEIQIETERARQISGIHYNEAKLLLEDGRQLRILAEQERVVDEVADSFRISADFCSAMSHSSGNWWEFLGEGISATVRQVVVSASGRAKTDIAQKRIDLEARQRARVEFNHAQAELINSAAVIKTKLLEQATLEIDLLIAQETWAQALEQLAGIASKVRLYQAQAERYSALTGPRMRLMLGLRLYSDKLALRAQESFRTLQEWAYLATRAMEYELNSSYGDREAIWQNRSADELDAFLWDLEAFYRGFSRAPQTNLDVISLRDDVLELGAPVRDAVTGQLIEPRERFRRFVADPANRDVDGNLTIAFSTSRPDKSYFSKAVCSDRIRAVRVNLVGDNLGAGTSTAFVKLAQGGANYLRSCGGTHELIAYDLTERGRLDQDGRESQPSSSARTARIQAGVNAPDRNNAGLPNTDLVLRAVLAGEWQLVIEKRADIEPANANLDVAGLDDIELIVEHEAETIQ